MKNLKEQSLYDPASNYCPSDTECAYCGSSLPENTEDMDNWQFIGFCRAECCLRHHINFLASFPNDKSTGETRREVNEAIEALANRVLRDLLKEVSDSAVPDHSFCGTTSFSISGVVVDKIRKSLSTKHDEQCPVCPKLLR